MPPIPNMPAPFDAVWRRACQPSYLSQPHTHWLSAWYRKKTKITEFPWHYFNYIHSYLFFLGARTNYPASASSNFKLLHHHCLTSSAMSAIKIEAPANPRSPAARHALENCLWRSQLLFCGCSSGGFMLCLGPVMDHPWCAEPWSNLITCNLLYTSPCHLQTL